MKRYRIIKTTYTNGNTRFRPQFKKFGFWWDFKFVHQGGGSASFVFNSEAEAKSLILRDTDKPAVIQKTEVIEL